MFCPGCGSEVPINANACPRCGRMLTNRPAPGTTVNRAATTPQAGTRSYAVAPRDTAASQKVVTTQSTVPTQAIPASQAKSLKGVRENRSVIKLVIFNILTFTIYGVYFVYKMAKDMNEMCRDDNEKTPGFIVMTFLSIITLGIYPIYYWYMIANRIYKNAPSYGIVVEKKGTDYLFWGIAGYIFTWLTITFGGFGGPIVSSIGQHKILQNMNALAHAYNQKNGLVAP